MSDWVKTGGEKMSNESVDCIITDPPYKLTQKYGNSIDSDNLMAVASIINSLKEISRVLKKGRYAVIFYDNRIGIAFIVSGYVCIFLQSIIKGLHFKKASFVSGKGTSIVAMSTEGSLVNPAIGTT